MLLAERYVPPEPARASGCASISRQAVETLARPLGQPNGPKVMRYWSIECLRLQPDRRRQVLRADPTDLGSSHHPGVELERGRVGINGVWRITERNW